jgi:uncharacterized membrane protein
MSKDESNVNETQGSKNKDRKGLSATALKVYVFSVVVVIVVFILGSVLASSFSTVSVEVSARVLENVIRLDGVLFGFTAAMLSILFLKGQTHQRKFLSAIVFTVIAFLSFLLSMFMSFSFLMTEQHSGGIFLPVILTCFGGLSSSVYVVLVMLGKDDTEK